MRNIGIFVAAFGVFVLLGLLGLGIGSAIDYNYSAVPEYNKVAGGYFDAAYWSDTPELMKENVEAGRAGFVELGLEPGMYGSIFSWHHTPDNKMSHQYDEVDALIERIDDVIRWREQQDKSGDRDQMTDVYQAKLDSIRNYMKEDCGIDCIGKDVWLANNHVYHAWLMSFFWIPFFIGPFIGVVLISVGVAINDMY